MTPTVGRLVHFYNEGLGDYGHNGLGPGPYHAVIVQVFSAEGDDPYVNLTVFPPFSPPFSEGSVKLTGSRRYEWPPRT